MLVHLQVLDEEAVGVEPGQHHVLQHITHACNQSIDNQPTVLIRTTESDNPIKYSNQFCTAQEKSEHMQSQYWFDLKQYRLALANYVCESCGTSGPLELHHVDYSNLLAENINDVRVICRQCHQAIHDRLGYSRETYYNIKD